MPAIKRKKQLGASLSVALNCFLILIKLVVGIISGSVGVLASSIDSLIDLVASLFSFFAVSIAEAPPDADHPFGHGKFEDFAGLIEATLIMVGAFFIIWQSVHKLLVPSIETIEPIPAIVVMGVSLVLDLVVSQFLFRIAKETESSALYADAHHLTTDFWTSIAVIVGLVLVKWTHNSIFDPVMALFIAGLILMVGIKIIKKVFNHLMDTALPFEEEQRIIEIIHQTLPAESPMGIDSLKTRRSGSQRLIVFNLLVLPNLTVEEAHEYCDQVELALSETFPGALITIHIEPYRPEIKQLASPISIE